MAKDTEPAAPARPEGDPPQRRDEDLEIIEQLLGLALEAIDRKTPEVRLADVLKLLEFKHRLKPQADARAIFWEWIERFRRDAARGDEQPERGRRSKAATDNPDVAEQPLPSGEEAEK